jgi:glycosyltransferase involved in cell wall biosynthesis
MKRKKFTRRLRLRLAPPGSSGDRWLQRVNRTVVKLRTASPSAVLLRLLPAPLARRLRAARRRRLAEKLAPLTARLQSIVADAGTRRPLIIFPPGLDWDTQLFQRPQHLALALSRQGALVIYVQPQVRSERPEMEWKREGLLLGNFPVEALAAFPQPLVYLLTWNRKFAAVFDQPRLIYDYVDDINVFEGDPAELQQEHRQLVSSAELVLATALNLYQETRAVRPDALLCPNGVEYDRFSVLCTQTDIQPPDDLQPILARGFPVVGYYGALAQWFDYDLIGTLARTRPDLSIVLIGPDYDGTLPPDLLELPNLDWLGVKAYADLPAYLRYFDVATIPFKLNAITHATSPLKLFEYMAACKPTIITPMQESMRYPGVIVAADAVEFSAAVDRALIERHNPEYLSILQQVARENTWDARAQQILETLALKQSPAPASSSSS